MFKVLMTTILEWAPAAVIANEAMTPLYDKQHRTGWAERGDTHRHLRARH
jgi:hypothetical protein